MDSASSASEQSHGSRSDARRLPYQPGLDGLRALAVSGVFLYHAGVSWMPGGFLGVDLFFALSGYLITSLLLREFAADGTIALRAFWARRARRLFPAVAVVIAFALLATLTIARDDLSRTRADAISAIVYLTNWHEVIANHSYFNQFGRPSLLQNLWSLAVEEQFYLVWPPLLLLGLRRLHPRSVWSLTAVLALVSVLLMAVLYNPNGDPSRVYYGTDTRAFTLLIGALLAFALPGIRRALAARRIGPAQSDFVGLIALVGVLILFVSIHDYQPWLYRGGFLVMALIGAVLIGSVVMPGSRLGHALGWEPLRWLGVRSYGIYLWHWPIMQLTRPGVDVSLPGPVLVLLQATGTVAVAALSYRYVETPIRSGRAQLRLRAFLDRHTPHQRLAWVTSAAALLAALVAAGFGLPAPATALARQRTATPQALTPIAPGRGAVRGLPRPGPSGPGGADHPPPSKPERSRRPPGFHGEVLAAGDSVMLGAAANLEALIGRRLRVDAVVGRQAEATIARLAQYRAAGRLPREVIVQIGDNGPVWYSDMQNLRRVLRGVPVVVIVNVRLARSWQGEVDHQLAQYVRTWPQAVLANWFAHSTRAMLVDGVHPQVWARAVYARVVYDALKRAQRRARTAGRHGSV